MSNRGGARQGCPDFHRTLLPDRRSFATDGGGRVMITALKEAEDGHGLVVRAVETLGEPADARFEVPVAGRVIEAAFGPGQIRTFLLPDDLGEQVVELDLLERPVADQPAGRGSPQSVSSGG